MLQHTLLERAADAADVSTSALDERLGVVIPAILQVAVPRIAGHSPSVPMQFPTPLLRPELERQTGQVQGQSCRPFLQASPIAPHYASTSTGCACSLAVAEAGIAG